MDKKEYLDTLTKIGTCEDETQRRDMLATLNKEAETLFDNNATLTTQNEAFKADNELLRSANMKLFLQVGASKSPEQRLQDQTGHQKEEPEQKLTYDDLFKEGGSK